MLFFLLFYTFLEHLQQLLQLLGELIASPLIVKRTLMVALVEPVPELLGQIIRSLDVLEIFSKDSIKFIIFRLSFYQDAPAQVIELHQ